jgi:hypothetical protein|tara:strand:- start:4101 stop:5582 length:1482 start_codon:yes stop_codon:yes gene_type:complete
MQAEQSTGPEFALPLGLRYNLNVADAVPSSKNIQQFLSSNASTFTGTGNNVCRIPVGSPAFLDLKNSLLQVEFTNTTATNNTVQLDGGVDGCIRRLRIISSDGSVIEEINQYGLLSSVLDQYTMGSGSQRTSKALKGAPGRNDDAVACSGQSGDAVATGAQVATTYRSGLSVSVETKEGDNTAGQTRVILGGLGGIGYDPQDSDILNKDISRKYMFHLKAGFFNLATAKLLMPNTNFTLEIEFNDPVNCLKSAAAAPLYSITNVELHVPAIVINDASFMQRMNQRMNQGVVMSCNSYSHFINTTGGNANKDVSQISARARSLKGLMSIFRLQTNTVLGSVQKLSKRSIQYLDSYQYRIGSTSYPVDRVDIKTGTTTVDGLPLTKLGVDLNISEAYSQALRLTGNLNVQNAETLIDVQSFANSEVNNGTGIAAIDLSTYADNSVNSGISTLDNMPISFEYQKNAAATAILQIDTFAVQQMTIVRAPSGVLSSFM